MEAEYGNINVNSNANKYFSSPSYSVGTNLEVVTAWCNNGLLVYSVYDRRRSRRRYRVPATDPVREHTQQRERDMERSNSPSHSPERPLQPVTSVPHSIWDEIVDFARQVLESGENAEQAALRFLTDHPEVVGYVIAVGALAIIAMVGKDIVTLGWGLIMDVELAPIIYALMNVAIRVSTQPSL